MSHFPLLFVHPQVLQRGTDRLIVLRLVEGLDNAVVEGRHGDLLDEIHMVIPHSGSREHKGRFLAVEVDALRVPDEADPGLAGHT